MVFNSFNSEVRLINDWSTSPEAERFYTEAAAPSWQTTQADPVVGDSRDKVVAQFLSAFSRRISYDGGAQTFLSQWPSHEMNVAFYAVVNGSNCRSGAGKKKGGGSGASSRMRGRRNGRK